MSNRHARIFGNLYTQNYVSEVPGTVASAVLHEVRWRRRMDGGALVVLIGFCYHPAGASIERSAGWKTSSSKRLKAG